MKKAQKILVNRNELNQDAVELLQSNHFELVFSPLYASESELIKMASVHEVTAMIVSQAKITKKVIASTGVKVIVKHGSGVNNINLQAAEALGVPVYRALGANAQSVAEHALGMIFALRKSFLYLDAETKKGRWLKGDFMTSDIEGAALGLIGLGEIGYRVANMAVALGMNVIAFDPFTDLAMAKSAKIQLVSSPKEIAAQADIISLHCPLTAKTSHLIDIDFLATMKPNAVIINTARGGIIDEDALANALINKVIAGAALDSFENEPPQTNTKLWQSPNLLTTPHIAGQTPHAIRAMAITAAQIIIDYLQGKKINSKFRADYAVLGGLAE